MSNIVSIATGAGYRVTRTPNEVSAELTRLAKVRGIIPAHSAFGDDNHAALDAQMGVLRERMTLEEVTARWDCDNAETYVLSGALNAAEWLRGEGNAPSEEWLGMVGDEECVN